MGSNVSVSVESSSQMRSTNAVSVPYSSATRQPFSLPESLFFHRCRASTTLLRVSSRPLQ
jgi:hypothetical protein